MNDYQPRIMREIYNEQYNHYSERLCIITDLLADNHYNFVKNVYGNNT